MTPLELKRSSVLLKCIKTIFICRRVANRVCKFLREIKRKDPNGSNPVSNLEREGTISSTAPSILKRKHGEGDRIPSSWGQRADSL
jgi:hypothetical protein